MKILHFVDTAGSDENFVMSRDFVRVEVENATSVKCHFRSTGELTTDVFDITVTSGQADEVALVMAEYMADGSLGHGGIHKFVAGEGKLASASSIAFTAGS
tara:strand:+ start:534 stop:836 length:303 start_codon:yes stop_codon:yes gene_type:complete